MLNGHNNLQWSNMSWHFHSLMALLVRSLHYGGFGEQASPARDQSPPSNALPLRFDMQVVAQSAGTTTHRGEEAPSV
ncbi:uncharacterized protein N7483_007009 [Penicillium malachiteum]|uniref:uncharacterized protein n=1 Tax=Penicillium malachiteum TaxID=1324776 RepID=UPI002547F00F|nr:uncharacterized protein N7483_007009 [Penicillium malachiteum]KAJ5725652.1 hypothetical protein N7483_007009 [Penicillium malachiteum]